MVALTLSYIPVLLTPKHLFDLDPKQMKLLLVFKVFPQ